MRKTFTTALFLFVALLCLLILPVGAQAATEGIYTYEVANGEATITACDTSVTGGLDIPSSLGGYPVTAIGEAAFKKCTGLTAVTIPGTVTTIGKYAFHSCTAMASVYIPDSVDTLGDYAFYYCDGLTTITIPGSISKIGDMCFYSCAGLTSVIIQDGVTTIGTSAFNYCTKLSWVLIPDSVTTIVSAAFRNLNVLDHVLYTGTQAQWEAMTFGSFNTELTRAARHYEIEWVSNCINTGWYCPECADFIVKKYEQDGQHSYQQGICSVCGAADPDYVEQFDLMGTNLTMGNDLDLQFAVSAAKMTDWTGCYFELVRTYANGAPNDVQQVAIDNPTGSVIIVKYEGLAAKEMGDEITVTIYNAKNQAISNPYTDSIASYAVRMLRKSTIPTQKQLIVDMLAYGAAAQSYLQYDPDRPVTSLLTDEERATITTSVDMTPTLHQNSYHGGSNLTIKSNIIFRVALKNVPDDATITAAYTTHTGGAVTVDTYMSGSALKILTFDQMVVSDARQVITITITDAQGEVTAILQESIADYLGRQADTADVFKAVMAFSDSAYAYLHRNDK